MQRGRRGVAAFNGMQQKTAGFFDGLPQLLGFSIADMGSAFCALLAWIRAHRRVRRDGREPVFGLRARGAGTHMAP
jgi:hypothetical protein